MPRLKLLFNQKSPKSQSGPGYFNKYKNMQYHSDTYSKLIVLLKYEMLPSHIIAT